MRYLILVAALSGCAGATQKPAPNTPETTKGVSYEADLELCESQHIATGVPNPFAYNARVVRCMNAKGWAYKKPKQDAIPK